MPYDTLEWSLTPVVQDTFAFDAKGIETVAGQKVYAAIAPIVNGTLLSTSWVFDTTALLVRNNIGYHLFNMFTCSCGEAGCAGIHDEVHLRVQSDIVQWQFPRQKPFIRILIPTHFASVDSPLVWTFDASAYATALASLIAMIEKLETQTLDMPVELWPQDGSPNNAPTQKVLIQLETAKRWFNEYSERTDDARAYWGSLYAAALTVPMDDATYNISVQNFLEVVCDQIHEKIDDTETDDELDNLRETWKQEQTGYFKSRPEEFVTLFKSMPWEELKDIGYVLNANSNQILERIGYLWPNVNACLVSDENPENMDWTKI